MSASVPSDQIASQSTYIARLLAKKVILGAQEVAQDLQVVLGRLDHFLKGEAANAVSDGILQVLHAIRNEES